MIITGKRRRSLSYLYPWQHRVCIDNKQNSSDLEDYQIKVSITDSGMIAKMKEDGGDIRFYAGLTKLSYWIEKKTSSEMIVWVKVPSIPGSSTTRIYMYYGNPSASSESNGEVVFEFFDDFEETSLDTNKWTKIRGTVDIVDGKLKLTGSGEIWGSSTGGAQVRSNIKFDGNFAIYSLVSITTTDAGYPRAGVLFYVDDGNWATNMRRYDHYSSPPRWTQHFAVEAGNSNKRQKNVVENINPVYLKLTKEGNTYKAYYSEDGISYTFLDSYEYNIGVPYTVCSVETFYDSATGYFYYIFVCKYTDPEPTITIEN